MASSTPIYKAYVGVIPTAKGFGKNLEGELAGSVQGAANRAGDRAGRSLGSRLTGAFKSALKIGGVITAAVGAAAIGGGIVRQLNIEDATAKLDGLGHSAKDVDGIMTNALASVKGTAYGLDTAATQAAGAVAAGIKPGKELENYLRLTADASTIAGTSMEEMGSIFNGVQSTQTVYTQDLNMMAERGIPIFQWLQDEYGVTAEELSKMVSSGEVDAKTYFKVIEENIGGAALKSGATTRGAFKNMLAALSRIGVALTAGFFPLVKQAFGGITDVIDAVEAKIGPILAELFEGFTPAAAAGMEGFFSNLTGWIEGIDEQAVITWVKDAAQSVKELFAEIKGGDFSGFKDFFSSLTGGGTDGGVVTDILSSFSILIAEIAQAAPGLASAGVEILSKTLGFLAEHMDTILKYLPLIVGGFLAMQAAGKLWNATSQFTLALDVASLPLQIKRNLLAIQSAQARGLASIQEMRLIAAKRGDIAATTQLNAAESRLIATSNLQTGAKQRMTLATLRSTIAEKARTVATKIGAAASKAAAIATRLLGAALRFMMGPVGLVITGITLLVAGLIWFFTQTELGQKIWEKVWGAIKAAAMAVVNWFMGTAVPWLVSAWDAIAAGAVWLYQNAIKPVWNGIKIAVSATINWITGTLVPALVTAWNGIASVALWLYHNVIQPVWEGIKIAIAVVVTLVILYVKSWIAIFQNVLAPMFMWLYNSVIKPVWNWIKTAIAAVINWFRDTAWPAVKLTIQWIGDAFKWVYNSVIKPVWNWIKGAINAVIVWFRDVAWPLVKRVIDFFALGFRNLYNFVIKPIWDKIKAIISSVVSWFKNTAWPIVKSVIDFFALGFRNLYNFVIKPVWDKIRAAISAVVAWFRDTAWPIAKRVIDRLKAGFQSLKDRLKAIWSSIKNNIINPVVAWFRDTVKPIFDDVLGKIKDVFRKTKDDIGTIWDKLKEKVKKPIEIVINKVVKPVADTYDKVADVVGAKKINMATTKFNFWKGGTLPGYTPGKDVFGFVDPVSGIRLNLSGGEPIMRPEFGRAMGRGWIDDMNAAARSGGVGGVRKALGFHTGGVMPGGEYSAAGGAWDWVKKQTSGAKDWLKDAWDTLSDFLDSPKKAFNAVRDGLLARANLPDDGWGDLLTRSVKKLTTGAIDTITGAQAKANVPAYAGTEGTGTGTGGSLGWASQIARQMGLTMTSGYRPGARTSSGSLSMHGLNRARDFSNGVNTPGMMAFFNKILANSRPTELLYTPAGGRNVHRGGRQYANTGATARNHYNHVHVAFKEGGMFEDMRKMQPRLMDQGGYLGPGVSQVLNKTGGYETLIPRAESEMLRYMSSEWKSNGSEKVSYVYSPNQVDMDETVERRTRREFETFVDLAKKASR